MCADDAVSIGAVSNHFFALTNLVDGDIGPNPPTSCNRVNDLLEGKCHTGLRHHDV